MDRAEDPATLAARSSLAAAAAAADRQQLAALLPGLERVLGAEDLTTLAARGRYAELRGDDGDFEGARLLFAALVPDLQRVLGAEHPETLGARASLAQWTGMAGFGPAVFGARRVTLRVQRAFRRGRCRCHGCACRAAARDQLIALLPDLRRVLGPAGAPRHAGRPLESSSVDRGGRRCGRRPRPVRRAAA